VVLHLPLAVAVAHNAGAAGLLLILVGAGERGWRYRGDSASDHDVVAVPTGCDQDGRRDW
jgi:heme a synthase